MTASQYNQEEYQLFQAFLENACGIVLGENKHYLVNSRLSKLMREQDIPSLTELVARIDSAVGMNPLKNQVIEAMTTNETLWFRDGYPFEILPETIFTEYKNQKKTQIKILSAACSSGQEPYSISIIADEFMKKNFGANMQFQIVGIDIDQPILNSAREAKYESMALARGLSEERKQRYFTQQGNYWQVNTDIRSRVTFREHNLMQSYASLGKFDVIFCRNVLIYFSAELKKDILSRLASMLNPGGYLFLGSSESIVQYSDSFNMIRTPKGAVYQLKP
ncbi:MAG: protein-glutamate O-methyltransferase CheR [Gammaproteobacteria bacterium]|nr:protein-glutamate O-methyltransferase CheR [Gammaproteobacteria bacterium]